MSDEELSLVVPYLLLMKEYAEQRHHGLRELFNGLRYVIRYGIAWRAMPNDLRAVLRLAAGKQAEPTTAIIDSRTLGSTPESGSRAGYDGAKRKKGSKLHMAVDTLGHLLALHVTPANRDDLAEPVHLQKPFSRQQMVALNWYGPIRAIPDQNRQKPPGSRVSPSKSSVCRR